MFCQNTLKSFVKFTGKRLSWGLVLIKIAGWKISQNSQGVLGFVFNKATGGKNSENLQKITYAGVVLAKWKFVQNSHEKTCAWVSFSIKLHVKKFCKIRKKAPESHFN